MDHWLELCEVHVRNGNIDLARDCYGMACAFGDPPETFDEIYERIEDEPTVERRFDAEMAS